MSEKHKCCLCQKTDDKVKMLKSKAFVHKGCMELAGLGPLAKKVGWKKK